MGTDRTEREGNAAPLPTPPSVAGGKGSPLDDVAHLDRVLMGELSALNYHLGTYVLRFYDADAGRAAPVPVSEEQALADSVTTAADTIRARAERRKQQAAAATEDA